MVRLIAFLAATSALAGCAAQTIAWDMMTQIP